MSSTNSSASRPEVVERLVQGAIKGMIESVDNCTADEVINAYFTLVNRGILVSLRIRPGAQTCETLRHMVLNLLTNCADTTKPQ